MITDLKHHYKDRAPEETIQIIEDFFKQHNIIIKQISSYQSEINTYSCIYGLFWDNYNLLSSNGKGMTDIYAKASCYAELYERFCNKILLNDYCCLITHDLTELRKKEFGYYYHINEKEIDVDDILNIEYNKQFYYDCFGTKENIQQFLNIFTNNHIMGLPYKSLINDKIKYYNYSSFYWELGTTGLATGNTIEEALVQGSSELFERITIKKFFSNIQNTYYQIDETTLNDDFKDKLKLLRINGYEPYLFDLSYNFNLPVCLIVLYNDRYKTYYYNFGSSPVFDIAVERCFTEIYQGFCTLPTNFNMIPYDPKDSEKYIKTVYHGIFCNNNEIVNIDFVFHNKKIVSFNSDIFVKPEQYTNKELLSYTKTILIKNNYEFKWFDISQSDDIYTVHIISEDYLLIYRSALHYLLSKLNTEQKINFIKLIKFIYNNLLALKNKNQIQFNEIEIANFINELLEKCSNINQDIVSCLPLVNIIFGYKLFNPYMLVNKVANMDYNDLLCLITERYNLINFADRDTRQILWEENKDKKYSNLYLIYLLYIKNFYDLYTSEKYKQFLYMLLMEK